MGTVLDKRIVFIKQREAEHKIRNRQIGNSVYRVVFSTSSISHFLAAIYIMIHLQEALDEGRDDGGQLVLQLLAQSTLSIDLF